jgi:hypothetical protein
MDFLISVGHNFTTVQFMVAGIVLVVLFLVGLSAFKLRRWQRNAARREHYVSDYDRTSSGFGSAHLIGGNSANGASPVEVSKTDGLSVSEREWIVTEWQAIQSNSANHPRTALIVADDLISALLETSGCYETGFEQREGGVSVDGESVMENYGFAHSIAAQYGPIEPTREELAAAMIKYRDIFDHFLQMPERPVIEPLHETRLEAKRGMAGVPAM